MGIATEIQDLTPHCFRHTDAIESVELEIDAFLARSLTGHKSERVFQHYIEGKRLVAAEAAFLKAMNERSKVSLASK